MKFQHLLSILAVALTAFLFSCKKDVDTLPPLINIDAPLEFTYYNVYDTIVIAGNVKDDNVVKSVNVRIVNSNLIPVLSQDIFEPNSKDFSFNTAFPINDIHLATGLYYVLVTASDGVNSRNLYRAINIDAVPLKFKKIVAIANVNTTTYNVYGVDDSLHTNLMLTYNGDYFSSALNNSYQQLYVSGNIYGAMNTYDLTDNSLQWHLTPENNPPFPSFNNVYFYNDILYVSLYNRIVGYNRQGGINMTANTTTGYIPMKTYRHKDYLIAEERNTTNVDYKLSIYYYTGSLKTSNVTSILVNGMDTKDDSHIYIFGNTTANKAVMAIYDVDFNSYYYPHTMPDATFYDFAKVDANNYLLVIGGNVYWYQQASNSLTTLLTNVNAKRIKYESLSGNFIIANGAQLSIYTYPFATPVGATTLPYAINDFLLLYNR